MSNTDLFTVITVLILNILVIRHVLPPVIREFTRILRQLKKGTLTKGLITGFQSVEDHDQHTQYSAIVEFAAGDGKTYTVQSGYRKMTVPLTGRYVDVCYDPENPEEAVAEPYKVLSLSILSFLFLALVSAVIDVAVIRDLLR